MLWYAVLTENVKLVMGYSPALYDQNTLRSLPFSVKCWIQKLSVSGLNQS